MYINETHERALQELNGKNDSLKISPDAQLLIDHYFDERVVFKRWPQSGKDFVEQSLESSSLAASANTRYLIEKGFENSDFGLINTISERCASADSDSQSCLTAENLFEKSTQQMNFSENTCGSC